MAWLTSNTGWRLQAQTNALNAGPGTNRADVAGASSTTNQFLIPLAITNASVFFRLVYP